MKKTTNRFSKHFLAGLLTLAMLVSSLCSGVLTAYAATDSENASAAANAINIPNADAIRGNITLPTEVNGAAVRWTTSNRSVIDVSSYSNYNYADTPGGIVTRGASDVSVTLTATVTYGTSTVTKKFPVTVKAAASVDDYAAYLYVHFNEIVPGTSLQQVYFGVSQDGLHWTALNNNNPILTSNLGDMGVRDPYIIRSAEGDRFFLIATDLDIHAAKYGGNWGLMAGEGSTSLIIWESTDLVNWSACRSVDVASSINAGCAWAPEAIYDETTGEYLVYWSSPIKGDTTGRKYIFVSKTRDFYTFTAPELYSAADADTIDASIYNESGTYYRLLKNSSLGYVYLQSADRLLNYTNPASVTIGGQTFLTRGSHYNYIANNAAGCLETYRGFYEGATMYKFNDRDEWCIFVDEYGGLTRGYIPFVTNNLNAPNSVVLMADGTYSLTEGAKHGGVIPITQAEYDRLMGKWGSATDLAGEYYIKNANSGLYLDVTDGSSADGTNIQQYEFNNSDSQIFKLVKTGEAGVYYIQTKASGYNSCVDVYNGSSADGTNICQWDFWGGDMQKYKFEPQSDGSYAILTRASGYSSGLDVYNFSTANGGNVNQWDFWGGACQKWYLEPVAASSDTLDGEYFIQNVHSGLYMDVYNASSADGANINQWAYNGGNAQKFKLVSTGEKDVYYILTAASGYNSCIDVYNGSSANGTNICQWTFWGGDMQKFKFEQQSDGSYAILTRASNYNSGLDMYNWSTENGGNVNQWDFWGGACQKWNLFSAS